MLLIFALRGCIVVCWAPYPCVGMDVCVCVSPYSGLRGYPWLPVPQLLAVVNRSSGWRLVYRHGPLRSNGSQAIQVLLLVNRVTDLIRIMRVFLTWQNLMRYSHHHGLVRLTLIRCNKCVFPPWQSIPPAHEIVQMIPCHLLHLLHLDGQI